MRLKEDSSSWKSSSIKRRDFRHDPSQPQRTKFSRKKDTKKWCKGRVGEVHELELKESTTFLMWAWDYYKCTRCGKKVYKDTKNSKEHQSLQLESHSED